MEKTYGLRAVKLTEIPVADRLRAARVAARTLAHDGEETTDLLAAALFPSDKTYWVRAQAEPETLLAA